MLPLITFGLFIVVCLCIYCYQLSIRNKHKSIPCPPLVPVLGNCFEFSSSLEGLYFDILRLQRKYGKLFQIILGPFKHVFVVFDADLMEKVMSTSKHSDKSMEYTFFKPWLGNGLLISSGSLWRKRRKMLTPAFHFTILQQAVDKFDENVNILVKNLEKYATTNEVFDIYPHVTLCVLDIICETAMDIKINAQTDSNSKYVCAVRNACCALQKRFFSVVDQSDFFFNNFSRTGKMYNDSLKILHELSNKVIVERREALIRRQSNYLINNEDFYKPKMIFLDTLLESTIDGRLLTNAEIREEVDTFMFEGHDTVSSAITFTLYLLANHPLVQDRLFAEIKEVLGTDPSKPATLNDLNNLNYIELVIKESLRLYPPVPLVGRTLTEDLQWGDVSLSKGSQIVVVIHGAHRHEDYFPEPEVFDPERFLNNTSNKNAFAYVPFSAGPRNCIGQKFAMYEMKSTISKILRYYELESAGPGYDLKLIMTVIFKSMNGVHLKLKPRIY
uniref:Cytochrome P450 CYP4XE3 n=1 Tax=Chrysoperla zastrowi sillemi TaxID=482137 RepID=A0A9E7Y688_9NEOP|nr:cytochrome P450 CYP4XE3 [Chrysoperla zastrowi sillemi]